MQITTKIKSKKKKVIWDPIPHSSQTTFLLSGRPESLVREVLYHGGRGFGKSECLVAAYLQHVGKGWGESWTGIILRREIKSLKDLTKKSHKIISKAFPKAEYNKTTRTWTFSTGEKLTFDFCKNTKDYDDKYHGQEHQFIGYDELTTWPDISVYRAMKTTLRASYVPTEKQPLSPPLQIRATTNPYGCGKGWVKEYFIDPSPFGVPVFKNGRMKKMSVYGSVYENTRLEPSTYIEDELESIADPVIKAAWLYGDWNSVDYSAIFGGLWSKHIELDPFTIPKTWTVNRTFDYGQSTPYACLWVAEASGEEVKLQDGSTFCPPAGSLIVVAEDYGTEEDASGNQVERNRGLFLSARPIARRIKAKEQGLLEGLLVDHKKVVPGPADNQIFAGSRVDESKAPTVAKEMKAEGVDWTQSDKTPGSRRNSAQIMIERLDATRKQDPERPHIYIFKTCRYTLKFLPELHRDDSKPDEVAKGADDHIWDALAYRLTQKKKAKTTARAGLH